MNDNKTYKQGDQVNVNGNNEAVIIAPFGDGMYEVRLWQGFRHIGDVCVCETTIKPRK